MDLISSLSSAASSAVSPASGSSVSAGNLSDDFQSMLQTMLTASMSGMTGSTGLTALLGGSDSTSGASGLGSSMSMIMLPMMFMMMEKMLQKQMELLQSGKASASTVDGSAAPAGDAAPAASSSAAPQGKPVQGGWLSQGFSATHNGLDFAVVTGTDVHSSMEGRVTYAGWSPIGYGNLVIVQNGDYQTYYAHLSKIPVSVGQAVKAGDLVGLSGSTGNSTGPHLHYEIRYRGKNIDPTSFTLKQSA